MRKLRTRRPAALTARWNKDLSISLYCRGKVIHKERYFALDFTKNDDRIAPFCEGWFGTEDRTKWRVRWTYA